MPRAGKRCSHRGCDEYQPCPHHKRRPEVRSKAERYRRSKTYDQEHRDERARLAPVVATGTVPCRRASNGTCLEHPGADQTHPDVLILANQPWQLGHPDAECPAPRAPEHRRCNTATRGRENRTRV